jgi:translation initiation factor IF-1
MIEEGDESVVTITTWQEIRADIIKRMPGNS